MGYRDLRGFVRDLEAAGELRRVDVEVDPRLEVTEIYERVVKRGGPALLFERPRGSDWPLLINLLGTERRVEMALGRPAAEIGEELIRLAERVNPPSPRSLWEVKGSLLKLLNLRTRRALSAPCQEVEEEPDLGRLPVQTCWPEDGGPFITLGLVITRDPLSGERNLGVYRMQVFDSRTTGMHWQIQKGGGFHYVRAEKMGRPLEVAVVLGADPYLVLTSVAALPEGMDEIAFSGLLRGAPCRMARCRSIGLEVPATAEIVLEGVVPPGERRMEGPFGDHFGHYSHAAPFPVFHVRRVTRRRRPIYLCTVVGKPPQEDKYLGNATQEILGPLIKVIHHEIRDLWAYFEAGFHNLLVVSVEERFHKEAVKSALALMGTGQLSLTKVAILVDEDVPVRDFDAVLDALRDNFDPARDFVLLPGVALDTLDFTSYKMNLGSKMLLDASSGLRSTLHGTPGADRAAVMAAGGDRVADLDPPGPADPVAGGRADPAVEKPGTSDFEAPAPGRQGTGPAGAGRFGDTGERVPDPRQIDSRVSRYRVLRDALMVVQVGDKGAGREVVERLVQAPLGPVRIVAAVSDDVPLDDRDLLIWGVFTRFDCARDVVFTRVEHRGPWTTCHGVMGIDATFKPGYPAPLEMDPDVVARVDRRWDEYGIE